MSLAPREQTKTSKTPGPASKAEVTTPDPGTLTRAHTHTRYTDTRRQSIHTNKIQQKNSLGLGVPHTTKLSST